MNKHLNRMCIVFVCVFTLFVKYLPGQDNQAIDRKVDSLLAKMTLEEKVGQMTQYSGRIRGQITVNNEWIRQGKIGSLLNVTGAENVNAVQKIAVEESRLGIPL